MPSANKWEKVRDVAIGYKRVHRKKYKQFNVADILAVSEESGAGINTALQSILVLSVIND
jgi:hypothetical protein